MSNSEIWKKAFAEKAFIGFVTAGDPNIEATEEYIKALAAGGADIIEIGIPFSDPVAEGPVIEAASARALASKTTTDKIFAMCKRLENKIAAQLVIMTYMNPVFVYGKEKFMAKCKEVGIKGLIVPDVPFEEKGELLDVCKKYDVSLISLIAPISAERIAKIAKEAEGFIYLVSSLGVTGVRKEINTDLASIIEEIKKYTNIPVAIGFGIATPEQAKTMGQYADGVIVGSAIVDIIAKHGGQVDCVDKLKTYAADMKAAVMGK